MLNKKKAEREPEETVIPEPKKQIQRLDKDTIEVNDEPDNQLMFRSCIPSNVTPIAQAQDVLFIQSDHFRQPFFPSALRALESRHSSPPPYTIIDENKPGNLITDLSFSITF